MTEALPVIQEFLKSIHTSRLSVTDPADRSEQRDEHKNSNRGALPCQTYPPWMVPRHFTFRCANV
jgi:hypothetical protein